MTPVRYVAPMLFGLSLALAACSSDAPASEADPASPQGTAQASTSEPAPTSGGDTASGACPTVPQAGYELSSSDAFSEVPADGAVWGDGTLISWTFADGAEHIVGVDMSYVNDAGDAIPVSGIFLDDMGGGTVGSDLLLFTSDADGRPGFMTLTETDGTDTETLGVYCVTFKVSS